jgi:hypothetical protein
MNHSTKTYNVGGIAPKHVEELFSLTGYALLCDQSGGWEHNNMVKALNLLAAYGWQVINMTKEDVKLYVLIYRRDST